MGFDKCLEPCSRHSIVWRRSPVALKSPRETHLRLNSPLCYAPAAPTRFTCPSRCLFPERRFNGVTECAAFRPGPRSLLSRARPRVRVLPVRHCGSHLLTPGRDPARGGRPLTRGTATQARLGHTRPARPAAAAHAHVRVLVNVHGRGGPRGHAGGAPGSAQHSCAVAASPPAA